MSEAKCVFLSFMGFGWELDLDLVIEGVLCGVGASWQCHFPMFRIAFRTGNPTKEMQFLTIFFVLVDSLCQDGSGAALQGTQKSGSGSHVRWAQRTVRRCLPPGASWNVVRSAVVRSLRVSTKARM